MCICECEGHSFGSVCLFVCLFVHVFRDGQLCATPHHCCRQRHRMADDDDGAKAAWAAVLSLLNFSTRLSRAEEFCEGLLSVAKRLPGRYNGWKALELNYNENSDGILKWKRFIYVGNTLNESAQLFDSKINFITIVIILPKPTTMFLFNNRWLVFPSHERPNLVHSVVSFNRVRRPRALSCQIPGNANVKNAPRNDSRTGIFTVELVHLQDGSRRRWCRRRQRHSADAGDDERYWGGGRMKYVPHCKQLFHI